MEQINIKVIKEALAKVLPSHPVAFAYVFGSQASGKIHPESDLDLCFGLLPPYPENFADLHDELLMKINALLPIRTEKLDISFFHRLPLPVRFRVIRDGKLLYLKQPLEHRLRAVQTIARYHDEEPFFRKAAEAFFTRMAAK